MIREPGLKPGDLADRIGISERTLFRDMTQLRRLGYEVTWDDGYQVQERFDLDGGSAPQTLARVYEQQLGMLRAELPPPLAEQVEDDVEALAPAALAILFASAIERRLDR